MLDEEGSVIKDVASFLDGATKKLPGFIKLLETSLVRMEIEKASEVILVGDGALWIWERIPKLLENRWLRVKNY